MNDQEDGARDVIELEIIKKTGSSAAAADPQESDLGGKHKDGARETTPSQEPNIPDRSRKSSTHDGVFSNLAAKPEVMVLPAVGPDAPPPYTAASTDYTGQDVFYGGNGYRGLEYDDLTYNDVEVVVSIFFEWIGFLVSLLLAQSHAAKWGAWTGFGVTVALQSIQLSDYARGSIYWSRHPDLLSGISFVLTFGGYVVAISSLFSYFRVRAEASRSETQSSSIPAGVSV